MAPQYSKLRQWLTDQDIDGSPALLEDVDQAADDASLDAVPHAPPEPGSRIANFKAGEPTIISRVPFDAPDVAKAQPYSPPPEVVSAVTKIAGDQAKPMGPSDADKLAAAAKFAESEHGRKQYILDRLGAGLSDSADLGSGIKTDHLSEKDVITQHRLSEKEKMERAMQEAERIAKGEQEFKMKKYALAEKLADERRKQSEEEAKNAREAKEEDARFQRNNDAVNGRTSRMISAADARFEKGLVPREAMVDLARQGMGLNLGGREVTGFEDMNPEKKQILQPDQADELRKTATARDVVLNNVKEMRKLYDADHLSLPTSAAKARLQALIAETQGPIAALNDFQLTAGHQELQHHMMDDPASLKAYLNSDRFRAQLDQLEHTARSSVEARAARMGRRESGTPVGGLSPEKKARLEELRRKRDAGVLR